VAASHTLSGGKTHTPATTGLSASWLSSAAAATFESTPNSSEYTPNSSEYTPNSSEYTSNSSEYTPNSSEYTSNSSEYTPNISEYTPNSSEYTPNSSEYTPNSSEYTPTHRVATYGGAAIGQMLRNIPMEGLRLVRCCGIFLWRGCDWSDGMEYYPEGGVRGLGQAGFDAQEAAALHGREDEEEEVAAQDGAQRTHQPQEAAEESVRAPAGRRCQLSVQSASQSVSTRMGRSADTSPRSPPKSASARQLRRRCQLAPQAKGYLGYSLVYEILNQIGSR
jgi:hypothetical protein